MSRRWRERWHRDVSAGPTAEQEAQPEGRLRMGWPRGRTLLRSSLAAGEPERGWHGGSSESSGLSSSDELHAALPGH